MCTFNNGALISIKAAKFLNLESRKILFTMGVLSGYMNIIFEIILVFVSTITTINIIKKKNYSLFVFVFFIYEVIYVLPVIFYWIFGLPDYKFFIGYNMAVNDEFTDIVYCILITIGILVYYFYLKKEKYTNEISEIFAKIKLPMFFQKNRGIIILILMFFSLLPMIGIIISPNPRVYLTTLGYFSGGRYTPNQSEIIFHQNTRFIVTIGFFSLILIRILTKNILIRFFSFFCIIFWVLFSEKRTSFALLIFAFAFIDIYKSSSRNFKRSNIVLILIRALIIVVTYFYIYGMVSGKNEMNDISSLDTFRQYFFRDADLKLAIYWRLNPNNYYLLDYNGQSLLYNLFFYIRRAKWPNKPWPYDVYATCGALGLKNFVYFDWNVQVNWISEWMANFGYFGYFIGLYSYIILDKIVKKINNPIFTIYMFYYFTVMSVLGFNSLQLATVILVIMLLFLSKKNPKNKKRSNNFKF